MMLSGEKNVKFKCIAKWVFLFLFLMSSISTVQAQQGLVVVPSSININGSGTLLVNAIATRTVVLNATDNITNINFIPLDLVTSDGQNIIPQQSITATLNNSQMDKGTFQQVPIVFSLKGINSGQYTGDVWFTYSNESVNGSVNKIPVTVTVKAFWGWALFWLFVTVLFSYALAYYTASFKHLDEIEKDLDILRKYITNDPDLATKYQYGTGTDAEDKHNNRYYEQIQTDMDTVEEKIRLKDSTNADTFFKDLQTTWDSWQKNRHQLVPLFKKFEEIIIDLNSYTQDIPVIMSLRHGLQDKFDNIVSDTGQKEMVKTIDNYSNYLNRLKQVLISIDRDEQQFKYSDTCKACKSREECKQMIKTMTIDNIDNTLTNVKEQLDKTIIGHHTPPSGSEPHIHLAPSKIKIPDSVFVPISPMKYLSGLNYQLILAKVRLFFSGVGAFLIVVAILIYTGYSQLYNSNPTFGASIFDWATLLLWGLMSGPSADAISQQTKSRLGFSK
ncbi:MAG TPA: hypothetical protein VMS89_05580 [Methanoregulaceae archaeon]|nr:hypothetical protein [Methanoregulaceae archaeon]